MQSGGDDQDIVSGINVTPLVDITLVLLIIFMVTATFVSEQGLSVALPKVQTQEAAPQPAITVSLAKTGELRLMKQPATLESIKAQMSKETQLDANVKVILKADKDAPYAMVAQVLDALKQSGVQKVALGMDRQ